MVLLTFDIILDHVMYKSHCMSQDSGLKKKKNLPRDFKQEEIKELSPYKLLNGLGERKPQSIHCLYHTSFHKDKCITEGRERWSLLCSAFQISHAYIFWMESNLYAEPGKCR